MAKKIVKISVSTLYELEVDDDNSVVQEYKNTSEIIEELISYNFSEVLPVLKEGIKIRRSETGGWHFLK